MVSEQSKQRQRESNRRYEKRNREKRRLKNRRYREKNREMVIWKKRQMYQKHREKRVLEARQYYQKHRNKCRRSQRKSYWKNREKRVCENRKWYKENRERVQVYAANKKARLIGCQGKITLMEWQTIKARIGSMCFYCLVPLEYPQIDHLIPFAMGGENHAWNIVPACGSCNRRKWMKTNWTYGCRAEGSANGS